MANKPTYDELERRVRDLEKEVSKAKGLEQSVQKTRHFAKSIVDTIREPLVILDDKLTIVTATQSFYESFLLTPRQCRGQLFYGVNNGQWDIPELRSMLKDMMPPNTSFENFEIEHNFEDIGAKILHLNARRTYDDTKKTQFILLAIEDVTERIHAEREMLRREARLSEAEQLALLGHWELDLVTN